MVSSEPVTAEAGTSGGSAPGGGKPMASGKAWLQQLVSQLESRQRPDGSFVNPVGATREDDPLVATPMAAAVLALALH
mgnify:CR=1 FL=1